MPLDLPNGWTSTPAPKGLGLTAKWLAAKDARLSQNLLARSSEEAHALARQLIKYCPEPTGADKWLLPMETLRLKAGDCEDWVLFTRALLINGGIKPAILWLLIVDDLVTHQPHALLWTPRRFCDCRAPTVLEHSKFKDYRPIAAFNDSEALTFGRRVA